MLRTATPTADYHSFSMAVAIVLTTLYTRVLGEIDNQHRDP